MMALFNNLICYNSLYVITLLLFKPLLKIVHIPSSPDGFDEL